MDFIKAITGGFLIAIGGTCFLSIDDKFLGAFMFSMGLLAICITDQNLFTGKVCYSTDLAFLGKVLLGNVIGAVGTGIIIGETLPSLKDKAYQMCQLKLDEGIRIIPLGVLCNILIYLAVEGYKKGHDILLIMCVMAFILCRFEHCVANMFYFSVAGQLTPQALGYILGNVINNASGGLIVQLVRNARGE